MNNDVLAASACCCIGPQNGEPVCPCRMRNVTIENGRYVRKEDLGPVSPYGSTGRYSEPGAWVAPAESWGDSNGFGGVIK